MFLPLGLSVYALGVAAAAHYFFGQLLIFGHHPGLIYVVCLMSSLCLCPLARQAPYARFYAGLSSFFTTASATLVALIYYTGKKYAHRNPFVIFLLAVFCAIPLLVLAVASPVLLYAYHMALARARRPFWLLGLQVVVLLGLAIFRTYAAFHPEYELDAFRAFGDWLVGYSLTLLTLAISYLFKPYQTT